MRKQYREPKLTRFGGFRDLTQGAKAGKDSPGFDLHRHFDPDDPVCNPESQGLPGCIS